MYVYLAGLILLLWFFWPRKEAMTSSPYDLSQEQAGTIQNLYDTLSQNTLTSASLQTLQDKNDTTTDQINELQANLPSPEPAKQYPPE
jgi:hypothetical protein